MTTQELQIYKEEKIRKNLVDGTNLIAQGFKHLQLEQGGCIQYKKKREGNYYVIKNGYGSGAELARFNTLKDALNDVYESGWGYIKSYK